MPPVELNASDISGLVRKGYKRMETYRNASAQAVLEYVGDYFVKPKGMTGNYPINLIFAALRTWVPNLVMQSGVNKVLTPVLAHAEYAELLGATLDQLHKKINMKDVMRAGVVNMILCGLAVFKTSIYADGNLLPDGFNEFLERGQLYTDLISLDEFFIDPYCTELKRSTLTGHFITVRRQDLLEAEGWNEELVMRLPNAWEGGIVDSTKARTISRDPGLTLEMINAQDYVRVAEVYLPEANAIAYVPDPEQATFDEYLKVMEYYGPSTGPYTFGSITPPVPDNPLPLAPASMWRDLNLMANSMFSKLMDQAEAQKDVLLYKPGMEDVADAVADAINGTSIRTSDPEGVKTVSYGGGNDKTDRMTQELQYWFNYLSGGIDQMGGLKTGGGSRTATAVRTLQGNATIVQEDARGLIYDVQAAVSRDQAWFIHYDPFLDEPLTIRRTGKEPVQVKLTPEQVRGDFLDLTFTIVKRSMQIVEPEIRRKALFDFCGSVLPAAAQAAMMFQQMGYRFDLMKYLTNTAEEMGITELVVGVFDDPEFQDRLAMMERMAGLDPGKAGKVTGMSLEGIMQNGRSPSTSVAPTGAQQVNAGAQSVAAQAQSENFMAGF